MLSIRLFYFVLYKKFLFNVCYKHNNGHKLKINPAPERDYYFLSFKLDGCIIIENGQEK